MFVLSNKQSNYYAMKKLIFFVFFAAWASLVIAQDTKSTTLDRKNVVKFLPVNLPFQSISFEYERMINSKNSFTLGFGLPNQKSMIGKYGIDFDPNIKSMELGTMHIRAAYRHYGGQSKLPKGFYIEPYLKYQKINGKGSVSGVEEQTNEPYKGDFDVNFNTLNLGFQLGAQFLIAKRVSLDFYFLGLEAGLLSGDASAISDQITDIDNLEQDMNDLKADLPSFIGDKLTVTKSGNKVNVNAKSAPYPWFRGGISIGIAF